MVLLHVVALRFRADLDDAAIRRELGRYQPELGERPEILVLNKTDLVTDLEALEALEDRLRKAGLRALRVSGATGEGKAELVRTMLQSVTEAVAAERSAETEASSPGEEDRK